jgi:hypothetical protein
MAGEAYADNFNDFNPDGIFGNQCVQQRLACSVGISPTRAKVRSSVTWVASVEETKRDEADRQRHHFWMVSESPGRNVSEPTSGLERK